MELREEYKKTSIGVLPNDWDPVPLGNTARIQRGASPRPIDSPVWFDQNSEVGWVRISDVTKSGVYLKETVQKLSEAGVRQSRPVSKGNLIMSICATVGRPIITDLDVCIHDGFVVFDGLTLNQMYAYHYLKWIEVNWSKQGQTGSQMNLNTPLINSTEIAVPPTLEEQTAIATALSDVDALIDSLDRLIAKKQNLKQAAMQELLTGKKRLPGFSGEWEEIQLGKHFSFLKNGVNTRAELVADSSVRYLHYGDIHGCNDSKLSPINMPGLPEEKAKLLSRLENGDLVFADASEDIEGVGKSVEIFATDNREFVAGQHTIAIRFDKSIVADGFKAYLQFIPSFTNQLRKLAAGTKVYATNRKHIAGVTLNLPKVEEQKAIAGIFSDMDTELSALNARREKSVALKQSMMQELLTGKTRLV